jgi:thioredoxin-like negative regulator of GroEL
MATGDGDRASRARAGPALLPVLAAVAVDVLAVATAAHPMRMERVPAALRPASHAGAARGGFGAAPGLALLLHVGAALLAGLSFHGWRKRRGGPGPIAAGPVRASGSPGPSSREQSAHAPIALGPMATALALCFPVAGAVAVLMLAVRMSRPGWHPVDSLAQYRELVDHLLVEDESVEDVGPHVVERSWRALAMSSFPKVLSGETDGSVIGSAFRSVLLLERPVACRLLRKALASESPLARYYASHALARVQQSLDHAVEACERASAADPDDPAATLALADARFAYADVDDPEDPVVRFHLEAAVRLYERCTGGLAGSDREHARFHLARALFLTGSLERARTLLLDLVEAGAAQPSILLSCLEATFATRDLTGMARVLALFVERCPDDAVARRLSRQWRVASGTEAAP